MMLKTAEPSQKQENIVLSKINSKSASLAAALQNIFSRCNNAGDKAILQKTSEQMLVVQWSLKQRILAFKKGNRYFAVG